MAKGKSFTIRIDEDLIIKVREKSIIDDITVSDAMTLFLQGYVDGRFGIVFGNLISLSGSMKNMSRNEIEAVLMKARRKEVTGGKE